MASMSEREHRQAERTQRRGMHSLVSPEEEQRRAAMSKAAQKVRFTMYHGRYGEVADANEWREFRLVWTQLQTGVISQGEYDNWVAKMNNRPRRTV